jgi:hypothetical protein
VELIVVVKKMLGKKGKLKCDHKAFLRLRVKRLSSLAGTGQYGCVPYEWRC